jgi:hypothetical protein
MVEGGHSICLTAAISFNTSGAQLLRMMPAPSGAITSKRWSGLANAEASQAPAQRLVDAG